MKKISLWATMLAMLLICGLCVTSCSKDDEEKDGGGKNGGKKEETTNLKTYMDMPLLRCERVGANLIVEMAFENKTGKDIKNAHLELVNGTVIDNVGNSYYSAVSLANTIDMKAISNYGNNHSWLDLNIPANGRAVYIIKIKDFDSSNNARSITFDATFSSPSLPADSYPLTATFPITDNRVMERGVQTNDTALVYKVTNCERVGSVLQVDFTVTNNSNIEMGNLTFSPVGDAKDNMGNSYYSGARMQIAFGNALYKSGYLLQLGPKETANGRVRFLQFDSTNRASSISFYLSCTAKNYVLSDDVIRFLTIPVTDNRVTANGIQSPDFKLDVKLTGAEMDSEGDLRVNYTIQNNTGENLNNFTIVGDGSAIDDLSNAYYSGSSFLYSINNSDYFYNGVRTNIPDGATVPATVAIKDFSTKAKNVTFNLRVSCDNYEFADNLIHFITIPVQR